MADSYESIIKVVAKDVATQLDSEIFKAVQEYAIDIDKDELIKALKYDRDQFCKGYKCGEVEAYAKVIKFFSEELHYTNVQELMDAIEMLERGEFDVEIL